MSNALIAQPMTLPTLTGSLESYIQSVTSIPVLKIDEERELSRRLHDENDLDCARQLVVSHLRFVVHIARGYMGYGLPLGDLIQEGNVGLMKAVKRFDPKFEVRLVSFAVHWIRAEIHEFVLRNWRIVKVATTKAQRKLFFNLRSAKKRLGWFNQAEVDAVANDLGVSPQVVMEMESRLSNRDLSFDPAPSSSNDDEMPSSPSDYLVDRSADPALLVETEDEESDHHKRLANALSELDDRSRDILASRWLSEKKATLHELAAKHSVSAERIRQIEAAAMKKMRVQLAA